MRLKPKRSGKQPQRWKDHGTTWGQECVAIMQRPKRNLQRQSHLPRRRTRRSLLRGAAHEVDRDKILHKQYTLERQVKEEVKEGGGGGDGGGRKWWSAAAAVEVAANRTVADPNGQGACGSTGGDERRLRWR